MFFSVKRPVKIAGKAYIPCICYPVTKFLERTILKLESEGKAVIYTERVFFQNGKVIEKTDEEILEQPAVKENLTTEKPKKDKKKAKAEETPSAEETDESAGF